MSDFLPTEKLFLDCILYEHWFRIQTNFCKYKLLNKKKIHILINDIVASANDNNLYFKLIYIMSASYKNKHIFTLQRYDGNYLNLIKINQIIKTDNYRNFNLSNLELTLFGFLIYKPTKYYCYLIVPIQDNKNVKKIVCIYNSWISIRKQLINYFRIKKNTQTFKLFVYQLLECQIFGFCKNFPQNVIENNFTESVLSESRLNSLIVSLNKIFNHYKIAIDNKNIATLKINDKNKKLYDNFTNKTFNKTFINAHFKCSEIINIKALVIQFLNKFICIYQTQLELYGDNQTCIFYSATLDDSCYKNHFLKNYIKEKFDKICVDQICVDKICVDKICVDNLI